MWERCTCCQQRGKSQVSYNAACGGGRIDLHSTANARLHLCTVFTASCDVLSSPHHRGVSLHGGRACAVRRRSFHAENDVCHSLDQCTTLLRRSRWNGFTSAEGIVLVVSDVTQSARRTLQHSHERRLHRKLLLQQTAERKTGFCSTALRLPRCYRTATAGAGHGSAPCAVVVRLLIQICPNELSRVSEIGTSSIPGAPFIIFTVTSSMNAPT